ncbi:tyrosine-type recombinase/integrase [Tissierella simiarum]
MAPYNAHDLRHTNAPRLMSIGISAKVVSERLDHSNISITLDTYFHVLQDAQKEAAEKIDNFFSSTK